MQNENFDYQTYMREHPPDISKIERGAEARQRRLKAAMKKVSVRIERDIFDQFEKIATPGQDSSNLINQASQHYIPNKLTFLIIPHYVGLKFRDFL